MKVAMDNTNLDVYSDPAVAAHYAALEYLTPCEKFLFEKYIKAGLDVLDIGVGGGRTAPYLSGVARHYVGVDYSEQMIRICREKFPRLEFRVADAADLSAFSDASFDAVVIAFNGLDMLSDQGRNQCLQECLRVLRPGGVLIFSSHNPRSILVRPAWSRERLRAFATRLVGGRIAWSHAAVVFLTPVKALHASLRAAGISIMRVFRRLAMSAFWRGEGSLLDSAHGGLITHYWIPERAIAEVSQIGFQLVTSMGDDFPRSSHPFVTDWYYYVFQK